jgi:hypothetical protein
MPFDTSLKTDETSQHYKFTFLFSFAMLFGHLFTTRSLSMMRKATLQMHYQSTTRIDVPISASTVAFFRRASALLSRKKLFNKQDSTEESRHFLVPYFRIRGNFPIFGR